MKRSGFSLIELVFSIVIIAISLMSVPMLISESNKGNQYSLIQESVMAARTKLGNILTFQWDDKSTVISGEANTGLSVVDTMQGNPDLNRTFVGARYRSGHIKIASRRRFEVIDPANPMATFATAIGSEATDTKVNDIDDFDGTLAQLISSNGSGIKNGNDDYLGASELNISTTVKFLNVIPTATNGTHTYRGLVARTINTVFDGNTTDGTVAHSTNIKMIELSVANAFSDEPFIFRAFSSNIGGNKALHSEVK